MGVFATLWVVITFWTPYPGGCPTGYIGPGGLADGGRHPNCTGGISTYIDNRLFGRNHTYMWGTFILPYETAIQSHDPEGALGSLNSIVLVYFGAVAGRVLLRCGGKGRHREVVIRLTVYGSVLCLLGGILCGFKQNGGPIPVCKNLWSTSFVLVNGGFAMWLLAFLYSIVDVRKWWEGKPFVFMGMNSILVYMASELLQGQTTFKIPAGEDNHAWHMFSNVTSVVVYALFAFWLHCHRWYYAV
jgi:heparan-alpha-glucosaminide N-acetyltransferase